MRLRLKVYRDLGFLPIRDTEGHFAKIIVSRCVPFGLLRELT
jgi:hypothetical protein